MQSLPSPPLQHSPPADFSRLSIVVPVLDEAELVERTLLGLASLREQGAEVIVVDGGSSDDPLARACSSGLCDQVLLAPRGRATQMNVGANSATREFLLFLHADTFLPEAAARRMVEGLQKGSRVWGRFDVRIEGSHPLLPLIAALMNLRSRASGIATGDQGIFVSRRAFDEVGGYPEMPLMEDIAISRRLKRLSRPICIGEPVTTSGRRWEQRGVCRTILLMWRLRALYFLGVDTRRLASLYGYSGTHE